MNIELIKSFFNFEKKYFFEKILKLVFLHKILILATVMTLEISVRAEDKDDNEELNIIELELEHSKPKTQVSPRNNINNSEPREKNIEFSELGQLAPFSEVSVIQKRFLPKTGRGQIFGGLSLTTNDPFFNTSGFTLKGSYYFTEMLGLELQYFSLSSSETKSTKELYDIQNIGTDSLSYTKEYLGLSFLWSPIYGKMTWFNKKIVPFDIFFAVGTGQTRTHVKSGIGTFQVETGQIFTLSKNLAVRWDFTWNFFSAKAINEEGTINNLFFSLGASYFFPEANYR